MSYNYYLSFLNSTTLLINSNRALEFVPLFLLEIAGGFAAGRKHIIRSRRHVESRIVF
jgi:hypothetical protein